MKIQCDFCGKEEASVFCTADEAALCQKCDKRVHNANKLATKHHRFSLLHPQYKEYPFCDICQERRALLFCQEDRALLCRECDIPIHNSNENTKKHNRFLLTGAKISPAISSSSDFGPCAASSSSNGLLSETDIKNGTNFKPNSNPNCSELSSNHLRDTNESTQQGSVSTSSISEYLTETLPGWQVEEFLELDPSSHYGLYITFPNEETGGDFNPIFRQRLPPSFISSNPAEVSDRKKKNVVKCRRKWLDFGDDFAAPQSNMPKLDNFL